MISMPVRFLLFIVFNAIGYVARLVLAVLMLKADFYPKAETPEMMKHINNFMFGGSTWIWIVCAVISVGMLLGDNPKRVWLLALPVVVPSLYIAGTILWFKTHGA